MRFAIAVLACALAVANGQFNRGAYNNVGFGNQGQYRPGQYNGQYQQGQYQQGQYNRFPQYNKYQPFNNQPFNNQPYKPFVNTTPKPVVKVVEPVRPIVPVAPVAPVVPVVSAVKPVAPVVAATRVVSDARTAETVKSGYERADDGSYNYFYETNNGIAAQEQGTPRNFGGNPPLVPDVAQGSFSWISPEGRQISVTYVADENGYQPQSDALPVAPAVPDQIARALAYVASKTFKTVN